MIKFACYRVFKSNKKMSKSCCQYKSLKRKRKIDFFFSKAEIIVKLIFKVLSASLSEKIFENSKIIKWLLYTIFFYQFPKNPSMFNKQLKSKFAIFLFSFIIFNNNTPLQRTECAVRVFIKFIRFNFLDKLVIVKNVMSIAFILLLYTLHVIFF